MNRMKKASLIYSAIEVIVKQVQKATIILKAIKYLMGQKNRALKID